MSFPDEFSLFLEPLAALQRLISRFGERGVVIGGVAASLLARPRLTADLDAMFLLSTDDIPALLEAAGEEGITPRIADAEAFARQHRVLLMRHEDSGINIDISLGLLPFEHEMLERSRRHRVSPTLSVSLPTAEDLVILKAVAHRPQDLSDIQALIHCNPDMDEERIAYWVRQFAQALDRPELWDDIAPWFR